MAEIVVPAQVFQQLIIVKVTVIAELAERVSSVTGVVRVPVSPMASQFFTVVPLALIGENLMEEIKLQEQVPNRTQLRQ